MKTERAQRGVALRRRVVAARMVSRSLRESCLRLPSSSEVWSCERSDGCPASGRAGREVAAPCFDSTCPGPNCWTGACVRDGCGTGESLEGFARLARVVAVVQPRAFQACSSASVLRPLAPDTQFFANSSPPKPLRDVSNANEASKCHPPLWQASQSLQTESTCSARIQEP